MSGVILYQSKYGATERYADWLAQATGFPAVEVKKARNSEVEQCDTIILGGGIYASGIAGLSFLRKHIQVLKNKRILVFCVGASPYDETTFQEIVRHNMKEPLNYIPCFYCRGAWNLDQMSVIDRNMCRMLRKMVEKKPPEEYEVWEKALMAAGDESCDWTDKKYLEPILNAIKEN